MMLVCGGRRAGFAARGDAREKGVLMKEQQQLLGMFLQCIDGKSFLSFVLRGLSGLGASRVNLDYMIF